MPRPDDFSLEALYVALDARRRARGLAWSQVTREINRDTDCSDKHRLSRSTITGTRTGTVAEADGVLQMLLRLDRTPESFTSCDQESLAGTARLPDVPPRQVLRFDTKKLYAALDALRIERALSWTQVSGETGLSVSQLGHLAKGGRTAFPQVMRLVRWLERPAADFIRAADY